MPFIYNLTYENKSIIIIDNCSTDGSVEWLNLTYPEVKIILNEANFGFSKGYNVGLKDNKSEYYLLLNTDVEVTPGLLEPMIEILGKDEKAAICQPKILSYHKRDHYEYAGAAGGMLDRLGYPFARGRLFFNCERDNQQYDNETEIFWSSGACFLIKSKCFWEANGFYEYFFMQSEEVDLCWRIKLMGYKVMFTPASRVYHLGGAHLSYESKQKTFLNFRNNWIMLYRNQPTSFFWLYIFPSRTLLDVLASFYFLSQGRKKNFVAVYQAILQFYKWLLKYGRHERFNYKKKSVLTGMHYRWIVVDYFIKRKKRYSDL